jgi:cystathionine gamma-lyase
MKFATKAIHAGVHPDPSTGAIMTPIFQTSTYVQDSPGVNKGYEYARTKNPTRQVLEANLAALENGSHGIAFSSGLAALDAIMKLLSPGDEVVSTNDLYGGSYRLMVRVYEKYGIKFKFVDFKDDAAVAAAITNQTKILWIETPTNPMLSIIDIARTVEKFKTDTMLICVDNTFASPYLQNPLDLGADVVLHSATKYINGHSDVVLGAVVVNNQELADKLYFIQNATGAVPGPQDCFLTIRGIKTLHIRVDRATENAKYIAQKLLAIDKVANVYYPGLSDHPGHAIAKKQMKDFGAMISFDLKEDTVAAANTILRDTKLFALAESLGGVESLIGHPATMTHASIPKTERAKIGLTESLIRLSVGIEDKEDLWEDLRQAIENPF